MEYLWEQQGKVCRDYVMYIVNKCLVISHSYSILGMLFFGHIPLFLSIINLTVYTVTCIDYLFDWVHAILQNQIR